MRKRIPKRVFAVADPSAGEPEEDKVWTISVSPNTCGWETDSGYPGYGLPKYLAAFYVEAINAYINATYQQPEPLGPAE